MGNPYNETTFRTTEQVFKDDIRIFTALWRDNHLNNNELERAEKMLYQLKVALKNRRKEIEK